MKKTTLLLVLALFLAITGVARAESYLSLYSGGAVPNNGDWKDNLGLAADGSINLGNSPTFGVKAGHWFEQEGYPYFGLEVEGNIHFPDWSSVTTNRFLDVIVLPPLTRSVSADTTLFSIFFNSILRIPGGPLRPYAGGGLGFAVWNIGDQSLATVGTAQSETDTAFAWNLFTGVDLPVTKKFSVFMEYKYMGADFSFPDSIGMDINYRTSLIYGGLVIRF